MRGYAAPAAVDVKPPVALFGVDGTYASALVCKPDATSCRYRKYPFYEDLGFRGPWANCSTRLSEVMFRKLTLDFFIVHRRSKDECT